MRCALCEKPLEPGSLRYVLIWKMFADYDGIIDMEDERSLEKTIEAVRRVDSTDLEEQIYVERRHLLCPACREELMDSLASLEHDGREPEPETGNGEGERNLH